MPAQRCPGLGGAGSSAGQQARSGSCAAARARTALRRARRGADRLLAAPHGAALTSRRGRGGHVSPSPPAPQPPRIPPAALAGGSASGSVARRGSSPAIRRARSTAVSGGTCGRSFGPESLNLCFQNSMSASFLGTCQPASRTHAHTIWLSEMQNLDLAAVLPSPRSSLPRAPLAAGTLAVSHGDSAPSADSAGSALWKARPSAEQRDRIQRDWIPLEPSRCQIAM